VCGGGQGKEGRKRRREGDRRRVRREEEGKEGGKVRVVA